MCLCLFPFPYPERNHGGNTPSTTTNRNYVENDICIWSEDGPSRNYSKASKKISSFSTGIRKTNGWENRIILNSPSLKGKYMIIIHGKDGN